MSLASLDDINLHLPTDKIRVDEADLKPYQLDAERIIRGNLASYFPSSVLALWTTPENTPGLIRAMVGRLVASFYYRQRYSEDSLDDPQFAQNKYDEAMMMLNGIMAGTIVVEDIEEPTSDRLTTNDFWPNDSTPEPKFTMEMNL